MQTFGIGPISGGASSSSPGITTIVNMVRQSEWTLSPPLISLWSRGTLLGYLVSTGEIMASPPQPMRTTGPRFDEVYRVGRLGLTG